MPRPIDHFSLLGMPRAATLDSGLLKSRYLAAARASHPDGGDEARTQGGADPAAVNAAYQCLLQPSSRLRHLLESVAPEAAEQLKRGQVPEPFLEIFSRLAVAAQQADALIARKKAASSALSRALLAADEMEAREALEAAGALISRQRAILETEALPAIDVQLQSAPGAAATAARIAEAFRAFGFLDKWQAQVRGKLLEIFEAGG